MTQMKKERRAIVSHIYAVFTALTVLLAPGMAGADLCFPKPVTFSGSGLSGPPNWAGSGTVRKELNEPRWAAAPQQWFESDIAGSEGRYRILVNSTYTELSVSFQVPFDPGTISQRDAVYFGFTTNGATATLASAIKLMMPPLPNSGPIPLDPVRVTKMLGYTYDAASATKWKQGAEDVAPDWLKTPYAWRNDSTAVWGINFKVDLTAASIAGFDRTMPFKAMLAMHVQDEVTPSVSLNPSSPNPNCTGVGCPYPLLTATRLIANPARWTTALAINSGCANGLTLSTSQLGTLNEAPPGTAAPTKIDTTLGASNTFYARPSYPTGVVVYSGMLEGTFHMSNWGSTADPLGEWLTIANGSAVLNGVAPATNTGELSFSCPTNTSGQSCGRPTPELSDQCVYAELHRATSLPIAITRATAFRCMQFKPLSEFSAPAEISVKGLSKILGNEEVRDVYLYVDTNNLEAHGNKQLYLKTDLMAATRQFAESPPPLPPLGEAPSKAEMLTRKGTKSTSDKATSDKPPSPKAPFAQSPTQGSEAEADLLPQPLPRTGLKDLDLTPEQALSATWPTYTVRAYYDTGNVIEIDGEQVKELKAMVPFTYHHSHEGPLYGFSHELSTIGDIPLTKIRDNVYHLRIPNEGVATIQTKVVAHEKPKTHGTPHEMDCPKPVEHSRCSCSLPGYDSRTGRGLNGRDVGLLAFGALALGSYLRRRRALRPATSYQKAD